MAIAKSKSFSKYNVTTGAGTYNLPAEDIQSVYGPGWPIAPVPRPEDSDLPREIDYPVAVNATLQPRIGYEGLMPVSALKSAYVHVSEVSTPVNMIIRELSGFRPMLKNKHSKQVVMDHPLAWMTAYPDRVSPFNVWLSRFKKSAKVYAAPAFYMRKDGSGFVDALEYIDGSTLFLIINSRGRLPEPNEVDPEVMKFAQQIRYGVSNNDPRAYAGMPEVAKRYLEKARERVKAGKDLPVTTPAFTQIIKGIPFSFWDKSQVYFVPDPPAPSVDSPYGETYIERSMVWIQIIAMLTAFELGHYRTGNMPEGFATMPKEWFPTMAKLALAEKEFNARMASGTQTEHARIRFGPDGMKYTPTKKPDFPEKLYTFARHNIYYALGMPTSEIGERSSRGLGGKGFEQGAAHDVSRQILESEKRSVEEAMNWVLLQNGVDDVEFYLDYPQEEIDPTLQQQALWNQLMHGTMTLNDVLTAQNKKPIGSPHDKENIANMHLFVAGSTIFVIEKMVTDERGAVARKKEFPPKNNQQGQPGAGGSPKGPEDEIVPEDDKKRTEEDTRALAKFIREMELSGGKSFGGTFYSISPVRKSEIEAGLAEEREEHPELGEETIAQLVDDHLKLDPNYYSNESSKRYKLKGNAVVNSETGKPVPGGEHENREDALAHLRALYANVSDAHKSEGGVGTELSMAAISVPHHVAMSLYEIINSANVPDGSRVIAPQDMHLSLVVMDKYSAPEIFGRVKSCVRAVANMYRPFDGQIQGFGVFNGEGERVLYASFDSPELPEIRQKLCEVLDANGIKYLEEHGFTPHITLAYVPNGWVLPEGFSVPDMPFSVGAIHLYCGEQVESVELNADAPELAKVDWGWYQKHCGVCEGDEAYFGAPLSRTPQFAQLPGNHSNSIEFVSLSPEGMKPIPALWKPEGGENPKLTRMVGGSQYVREEAAWLLCQSLGFQLVPLSYVSSLDNERGAAVWYVEGGEKNVDVSQYSLSYLEQAAVFDFISCQMDRGDVGHNYVTHPDDHGRMVLIDNGMSFPVSASAECRSVFVNHCKENELSNEVLSRVEMCLGDLATWSDIEDVLKSGGNQDGAVSAVNLAKERVQRILSEKRIPMYK